MKKWIAKAVVQKAISFLPFSHSINGMFQKWVTKGIYLTDEYFTDRLEHAQNHLKFFKKISARTEPESALETGTGWYPVVPVYMFLSGAKKILTIDISQLTNKERLLITIKKFTDYHQQGILGNYIEVSPRHIQMLRDLAEHHRNLSFQEISNQLNIHYRVCDARNLPFIKNEEIDLVTSNNTFEHIYKKVLIDILKEFKRITKRGGVMSHFIDMSDHFAHFDNSITIYNFLKFSDKEWKLIDNSIQPQNRLRINDYREIYKELDIPITLEKIIESNVKVLESVKTDVKYENIPPKDLAVSHCYLISSL